VKALRARPVLLGAVLAAASACANTDNNAPVAASGAGSGGAPFDGGVVVDGAGGGEVPLTTIEEPGYLWFASGALDAFRRSETKASQDHGPGVVIIPDYPTTGFHDLAFDAAGNLWTLPISGDRIMRLPAAALAASGPPAPDLVIMSPALTSAQSLVFADDGSLWVLNYAGGGVSVATVAHFDDPRALSGTVTLAPSTTIGSDGSDASAARFNQGTAIAFDGAGNLWLAAVANVLRFDGVKSLRGAVSPMPAVIISTGEAYVSIAFDAAGSLWVTAARAGYLAFRIDHPQGLTGIVSPTPAAKLHLPSNGELFAGGMAFDATGALWVGMSHHIVQLTGAAAATGESTPTPAVVLGVTQGPDLASKLILR